MAYPELAESFNAALYDAMIRAACRGLDAAGVGASLGGRSACDIGVGSGVWLDLWLRLGAESVAGVDLTEVAVRYVRERFPQADLRRADIADGVPFGRTFDLVSAMSILLHIKEDERFESALRNIAAMVSPGGSVLVMDPIVTRGWWGAPFDDRANSKARGIGDWTAALARARLELVALIPVTALLANPVDTRHRATFRALERYWGLLKAGVGRRERVGGAVGAVLTPIDRLVLRFARSGPSTKLLVARRLASHRQSK